MEDNKENTRSFLGVEINDKPSVGGIKRSERYSVGGIEIPYMVEEEIETTEGKFKTSNKTVNLYGEVEDVSDSDYRFPL